METIITRNTGTQETRGDEDYKLKPKQNHCYGHTPQIQKGAKTSNSGVERMPFVTKRSTAKKGIGPKFADFEAYSLPPSERDSTPYRQATPSYSLPPS